MAEIADDLYAKLEPWFELKVNEFSKQGYDNIHTEDIFRYFTNFSWKHSVPKHYYQQIQDIMKVTANHYFDFVALEAQVYKVTSLDEMNFDDFF